MGAGEASLEPCTVLAAANKISGGDHGMISEILHGKTPGGLANFVSQYPSKILAIWIPMVGLIPPYLLGRFLTAEQDFGNSQ